jgi:hypothetical protein
VSQICARLHRLAQRLPRLRFPFDGSDIPRNGIYLLFEDGETGHGGDRIVRIGTHTGQGNLAARLREHFLNENKDRSIFRKNIGRALLKMAGDPLLEQWELDLTTSAARRRYASVIDKDHMAEVERLVTGRIQSTFSFVVLGLDDKGERLSLEAKMIATVSSCIECGPSALWLGRFSPKRGIRESGLWQVRGLYGKLLSEKDLERLEERLLRS